MLAVWFAFPMVLQWPPVAYGGNASCSGSAQTSNSLIFAVMCRLDYENSPRATGMLLFWLARDWNALAFGRPATNSAFREVNFFWRFFPSRLFCPPAVRASLLFKFAPTINAHKLSSIR